MKSNRRPKNTNPNVYHSEAFKSPGRRFVQVSFGCFPAAFELQIIKAIISLDSYSDSRWIFAKFLLNYALAGLTLSAQERAREFSKTSNLRNLVNPECDLLSQLLSQFRTQSSRRHSRVREGTSAREPHHCVIPSMVEHCANRCKSRRFSARFELCMSKLSIQKQCPDRI